MLKHTAIPTFFDMQECNIENLYIHRGALSNTITLLLHVCYHEVGSCERCCFILLVRL